MVTNQKSRGNLLSDTVGNKTPSLQKHPRSKDAFEGVI
jgi:hypothetical protein